MDGVTDAAFRHMVTKYSHPSVIFTEFTHVEGLAYGATKILTSFLYEKKEHPIVAQLFGTDPKAFYKATILGAYLGFDGIDINMGCPSPKVAKQGAGASLIQNPKLAQAIISACQKAALDWQQGISLEKAGVNPAIIQAAKLRRGQRISRKLLPISVKTRIGYDSITAKEWANQLLEMRLAAITMHGRTFKQLYSGQANWEILAQAAALFKGTNTLFLGNGDINSITDAMAKIKKYKVDGVLVGRAALGNPWFFSKYLPSQEEYLKAASEHAHYLEKKIPEIAFVSVRKHLLWYCKNFPGAKELRIKLSHANTAQEVKKILFKNLG